MHTHTGVGARRIIGLVVPVLALCLVASTAAARGRRANMPRGHVWPPSKPMLERGKKCLERLHDVGIHYRRARRRRQVVTPIIVPKMTFGGVKLVPKWRKGPFVMDCHLAEALALVGAAWFELGVRELRFSSIYDYRNVRANGGTYERLSRHALGLAVDVYEVVDDAGTAHVVADHYFSLDLFLPAVEATANKLGGFRKVLSPLRDPWSHDDHFHLEARVEYPKVKSRRKRARKRVSRRKHRAKKRVSHRKHRAKKRVSRRKHRAKKRHR